MSVVAKELVIRKMFEIDTPYTRGIDFQEIAMHQPFSYHGFFSIRHF